MSLSIHNYNFEVPFSSNDMLDNQAGIFTIICLINNKLNLADIGESSNIKYAIEKHNKKDEWKNYCDGKLFFACQYTPRMPQSERMSITREIRKRFKSPLIQE